MDDIHDSTGCRTPRPQATRKCRFGRPTAESARPFTALYSTTSNRSLDLDGAIALGRALPLTTDYGDDVTELGEPRTTTPVVNLSTGLRARPRRAYLVRFQAGKFWLRLTRISLDSDAVWLRYVGDKLQSTVAPPNNANFAH